MLFYFSWFKILNTFLFGYQPFHFLFYMKVRYTIITELKKQKKKIRYFEKENKK